MAVNNPNGTEISVVIAVMMSVPTMACQAPPPSLTTPRIDVVKKSASMRAQPRCTTVHTTEINGSRTTPNADVTTAVARRSRAWRRPSTIRDTTYVPAQYTTTDTTAQCAQLTAPDGIHVKAPTRIAPATTARRWTRVNRPLVSGDGAGAAAAGGRVAVAVIPPPPRSRRGRCAGRSR